MKGKYAEEYWSLKKSGHQSLKSDEMSFGCLETRNSLQIGSWLQNWTKPRPSKYYFLSVDMYLHKSFLEDFTLIQITVSEFETQLIYGWSKEGFIGRQKWSDGLKMNLLNSKEVFRNVKGFRACYSPVNIPFKACYAFAICWSEKFKKATNWGPGTG